MISEKKTFKDYMTFYMYTDIDQEQGQKIHCKFQLLHCKFQLYAFKTF